MALFYPGTPRIALLNADLTLNKTCYLPPPSNDEGVGLTWEEKNQVKTVIDGSERCWRLGWIPELTLSWKYYDDFSKRWPHPVGNADGNLLDINSLLALLATPPGLLKISPGPSAGGFLVQSHKVAELRIATDMGITAGLRITFRGGKICSSMILESF